MPREHVKQLLESLASSIGRTDAIREYGWMIQVLQPSSDGHSKASMLASMLQRRISGEPLQYILGTVPFGPLDLLCRAPVLIPRPETEDWAIRLSKSIAPTRSKPLSVLDLCTGSGCIPLLLCHVWPPGGARTTGVDISDQAIQLAKDNAARCNILDSITSLKERAKQNTFAPILGDLRDSELIGSLGAPFDVLTANPPYIPRAEYDSLHASVKDYEDRGALLGDPPDAERQDGLSFYKYIAQLLKVPGILADSALVVLEVGQGQAERVAEIMREVAGMRTTDFWKDPWGKKRVVVARN